MITGSGDTLAWQLATLGVQWYINYTPDPREAPAGAHKVPFVSVNPSRSRLTPETITTYATAVPGSVWYIGGEPNVAAQDNISPAAYVAELDYYEQHIRAADPTAKIMSASILNWDFTCTGCGSGFTPGQEWLEQFVDAYAAAHGGDSPPVDIWAIDVYPLTWMATPQFPDPPLPMIQWEIVRDQLLGLRQFLDLQVPGHRGKPIWVTELASHWAYDGFDWASDGIYCRPWRPDCTMTLPEGQDWDADYLWDDMEAYMDNILGWLKQNGPTHTIERWFFFHAYVNIRAMAADGYTGIYFFESGESGAPLNQLGRVYRDYAMGRR